MVNTPVIFFFFFFLFIIYGCVGSSSLCEGFLQLRQAGATPHRGARASHYRGLSFCGAQAPDAQAQQLWPTGPVAPRHMGSSQTRARTRVPRTGRQTLNHCTTREAPVILYTWFGIPYWICDAKQNSKAILSSLVQEEVESCWAPHSYSSSLLGMDTVILHRSFLFASTSYLDSLEEKECWNHH